MNDWYDAQWALKNQQDQIVDVTVKDKTNWDGKSPASNPLFTGSVGINVATPSAKLDIFDTLNGSFKITEQSNADGVVMRLYRSLDSAGSPSGCVADSNLGGIRTFGYNNAGTFGSLVASIDLYAAELYTLTAQGSYVTFRTTTKGTVGVVERVRIADNGNVGIGTTDPKSKLHVVGLPVYANNAAAITGGLTAGAFYRTGGDPDLVCVVH